MNSDARTCLLAIATNLTAELSFRLTVDCPSVRLVHYAWFRLNARDCFQYPLVSLSLIFFLDKV